jgi:hypothetical protein
LHSYQDTSNNQVLSIPATIYKSDPVRDICVLQIQNQLKSNIQIGGTDDVNVMDNLGVIGFPHCTQGRNVLTFQNTTVGAKILIDSSGIKSKHLVLNIQARPGQSGSPIFRLIDSQLIGMIVGVYVPNSNGSINLGGIDPQTLHQTTHAVSTEYISKMI